MKLPEVTEKFQMKLNIVSKSYWNIPKVKRRSFKLPEKQNQKPRSLMAVIEPDQYLTYKLYSQPKDNGMTVAYWENWSSKKSIPRQDIL